MRALMRRWLPSPEGLRGYRALRWLGPLLDRPWLWAINRRGVALGLALGLFFGLLLPFGQALFAGALAVWGRANLPIAVAVTFISNPFTTPPIMAAAYYVGALAMGLPPAAPAEAGLTMLERASSVGMPLLAGLGMFAITASLAGFILVHVIWGIPAVLRLVRRRMARRQSY